MATNAKKEQGATAMLEESEEKSKRSGKWTPPEPKMVKARILNKGLEEGVDFAFNWRRDAVEKPDGSLHRFPILRYHLVNGEIYTLQEALVEHLEQLSFPFRKYKENAPEGESMPIVGKQSCYAISRI